MSTANSPYVVGPFSNCFVVSLPRRSDRLKEFKDSFPDNSPFTTPQIYRAIDGVICRPPNWFKLGGGPWGCYKSELNIIEHALNEGWQNVVIFEDDCTFVDDFSTKCKEFLSGVPDDWDMIYFGGQHLNADAKPPQRVGKNLLLCGNVNRTHAYAINRKFMETVYRHLQDWKNWPHGHHIDHRLGALHEARAGRIYAPEVWLCGQRAGASDVNGRDHQLREWQPGNVIVDGPKPFYVIAGLHSSGSSALAGMCWHLGMNLGDKLTGYYGNTPGVACGYEAQGLVSIMQRHFPFPETKMHGTKGEMRESLRKWINQRVARGGVAGGKYPTLCAVGPMLQNILGERLRIIVSDRDLEESIASIARRVYLSGHKLTYDAVASCQAWLHEQREEWLKNVPPEWVLRVSYDSLKAAPIAVGEQLCKFTGLAPSEEALSKAAASIKPPLREVKPSLPATTRG